MSRVRRGGTAQRLALLLAAVSMSLIAVAALDRPVRAATDVTAAQVIAAMESAGMDCDSRDGYTLCAKGADCELGADRPSDYQCAWFPEDGPILVATVYSDPSASDPPSTPTVEIRYEDETSAAAAALGAMDPFLSVIDAMCPDAADAAGAWFPDPTPEGVFPGDGCIARLTDLSGDESQEFHLSVVVEAPRPVASPSASPASTAAPSVAPSATAGAIVASPAPSTGTGSGIVEPSPGAGSASGRVAAPGEFVASVATPSTISVDPTVALQSAVLAIVVLLLMPFPAQLFNSTVEQNREEIRGWFEPARRAVRISGSAMGQFWRSPVGIGLFLAGSALLYALLDPGFTVSTDGLVTMFGILVGLVVVTLLFALPAVLWHRRLGDRPVIEAIPFTILVAIACVVISRIVGFQPGYLYGLVIGLGFARELDPKGEGRSGAAAAVLMLVAALLAWVGLGMLVDAGAQGFLAAVVETILAVILVAGLEGVAFGLLPIRFLPGEPIYAWNRIVWGALIGIGLFAFFHILINPSSGYMSDTSRTPLLTVVALLIGFGVLSVAFWGYFRFRPERVAT